MADNDEFELVSPPPKAAAVKAGPAADFELVASPQQQPIQAGENPYAVLEHGPNMQMSAEPGKMASFGIGLAQGAVPAGLGSFADEAVGMLDQGAGQFTEKAQSKNPIPNLGGQVLGGMLSPDPMSKIKAIRNAGVLAKIGYSGLANLAETTMSNLGAATGSGLERLNKAKDSLAVNGLWSLATAPLRALGLKSDLKEKAAGKISEMGKDEAKAAIKLGDELKGPLSTPQAQLELGENIRSFQPKLTEVIQVGKQELGKELNNLATDLQGVSVNIKTPLTKATQAIDDVDPKDLQGGGHKALATLQETVSAVQRSLLDTSLYGTASKADFPTLLAEKQRIGKMIWDDKAFTNDPSNPIRKIATDLYFELSDSLQAADKSGNFSKINKSFDSAYKLQEVGEALNQTKISGLADPQSSHYALIDEAKKIFKDIPDEYRYGSLSQVDEAFNEILPELIIKARVMKQVTGRLPGEQNEVLKAVGGKIQAISNWYDGNKLQLLNRLASEQAGKAAPIASGLGQVSSGAVRGANIGLGNLEGQSQ